MPRYDNVKCSTQNCTGTAKQNGDNPICKKCKSRAGMRRLRQQKRKNKEEDIKRAERLKPIPAEDVGRGIANGLIHPTLEMSIVASNIIDAYVDRRIDEEEKQISLNSDGLITECDVAQYGVTKHIYDLTDFPLAASIKRMFIVLDKNLSFEDKKRKLAKVRQ